ncbi:MAG: hypothetical protein QM767_18555 [Anaeromyxobacter sp.]
MTSPSPLHLGQTPLAPPPGPVTGRLTDAFGERCYVIENAQALPPFLVSVVSDADHWLFAASHGPLSAGRRSPATALFPYVTEDRIHDSAGLTGPVAALRVTRDGRTQLWRPLRADDGLAYRVVRRLYKNVLGNRLVYEEENLDLGLVYRTGWQTSARFGFVRECELLNRGGPAEVALLDGLVNLLPADVDDALQGSLSVLVDAYKRNEQVAGTPLALYTLAAQVVDRAEPRESLHATTVWSHGLPAARIHLEAEALPRFERGLAPAPQDEVRGRRGAYLAEAQLALPAGAGARWLMVADVARPQHAVAALADQLRDAAGAAEAVRADVRRGSERLLRIVASTDGLQRTADELATAHHTANVLFNDLRGGVPAAGGELPGRDLEAHVARMSGAVARRHAFFLATLPDLAPRAEVLEQVEALGDPDLLRLVLEYLPLTFSRRHGDPSRPWNRFDIHVRDAAGRERLHYQGNWRDIFQNWEALALSWPALAEGFVARFVNASTADGHNPYRISKDGIDWETPDPDHPWATIGYWGDHQLIYLLRLLQVSLRHHPERLRALLGRSLFTYADVPYELVPWDEILRDPRATIRFDAPKHARLAARARTEGADARLLHGPDGLHRVTLVEKLLVPALAKLANLVPGGGIWMNTQRPEWNDANNALVGHGLSVVTLCHLEAYLTFLPQLLAPLRGTAVPLSPEVAGWAEATRAALEGHLALLSGAPDDAARGALMAALGRPAGAYRQRLYRHGLSAPAPAPVDELLALVAVALRFVRDGLARNRRADGLFHAYNLLVPRGACAFGIEPLPEMLEGQVAALGTGMVGPEAALEVLAALRRSALYREDQQSYTLYPDRQLPRFLEKNVIPDAELTRVPELGRLLDSGAGPGGPILRRDAQGKVRFEAGFHNADACRAALEALREAGRAGLDAAGVEAVLAAYERVFNHRAFTGRSGSMFAYEGLGSIYWHMVAKLLVAVQEQLFAAADAGAAPALLRRLGDAYEALRAGVGGAGKPPQVYGAFPLDPYSHTPAGAGARQPGMTGQVKEEVITRLGELGVRVQGGRVRFQPLLLRRAEFLEAPATLETFDLRGQRLRLPVPAGALAFTYCQVPVIYRLAATPRVELTAADGAARSFPGDTLDAATSAELFGRTGSVRLLTVDTQPGR